MDILIFNERVKHGRLDLHPGVAYGFEDADAKTYFLAMAQAEAAPAGTDAAVVITIEELDIDPETVFADGPNRGKRVMEVANG